MIVIPNVNFGFVLCCRRRCDVAEKLVEKNFDLAFQIIYEFNLTGNEPIAVPLKFFVSNIVRFRIF